MASGKFPACHMGTSVGNSHPEQLVPGSSVTLRGPLRLPEGLEAILDLVPQDGAVWPEQASRAQEAPESQLYCQSSAPGQLPASGEETKCCS